MAKEKVTVVLTGDGGDEVFGGYGRYKAIWQKEQENGSDSQMLSFFYDRLKKDKKKDYFWLDILTFLSRLYGWQPNMDDKELRKQLKIDKDYDVRDILVKVDRASMAVSLEARVPLLARKLVEFSFSLSEEDRCPKGELKGLFKKAYEEEIGRKILYRKKMGFSMPHKYFGTQKTCQEYLLEDIWHCGIDGKYHQIENQ